MRAGWNPIKICGLQTPDRMKLPKVTMGDILQTMPVGFCSAAAHSAGVFCLGADPLFGQIVKAGCADPLSRLGQHARRARAAPP